MNCIVCNAILTKIKYFSPEEYLDYTGTLYACLGCEKYVKYTYITNIYNEIIQLESKYQLFRKHHTYSSKFEEISYRNAKIDFRKILSIKIKNKYEAYLNGSFINLIDNLEKYDDMHSNDFDTLEYTVNKIKLLI